MSLPDPPQPRKLSRLGLYLPFAIAVLVVVVWSGLWLYARARWARAWTPPPRPSVAPATRSPGRTAGSAAIPCG